MQYYGDQNQYFKKLDMETGEFSEKIEVPYNAYNYAHYAGTVNDFILVDSIGVFTYNFGDESVKKISEATELITSIASQTSLLSLNASIESARAGEAGRGFAVVASEIQKLSIQSNDAAEEIQQIIDTLLSESAKTLEEMQDTEALMKEQQSKLNDTKSKFDEVSDGIRISREETEQIRTSAGSCNKAKEAIMDVISNLSAISEENAASTEETSASMQELNATISHLATESGKLKAISQELNEYMGFFKI